MKTKYRIILLVFGLTTLLSGCASSLENWIKSPTVELTEVELVGLDFSSQTFLLSFDVSNPNGIALPIKSVSYGVKLNGQSFARGETASAFSVPANGASQFGISVDLDLLQFEPAMPGHALHTLPHDRQGILRQINQHRTRSGHGVPPQTRRAGGHAQG